MEGFDVLKVLGSGSFGRAMLCKDRRSGEEVVVKEIKCEDAKALAEAKSEADLMAQHEHSNICRYVASFADESGSKKVDLRVDEDGFYGEHASKSFPDVIDASGEALATLRAKAG